jgi:iron-sulfur cluster repair protein YtfE (RIC family)
MNEQITIPLYMWKENEVVISLLKRENDAASDIIKALTRERDEARARVKVLEEALRELADASDTVGIAYFDTDDMPPNVVRMQQATIAARSALQEQSK